MTGEEWNPCKKKVISHVRDVKGSKERVDTREGITWAYAETDYVMCGPDENGSPDLTDMYPIKKDRFHTTYELIEKGPKMRRKAELVLGLVFGVLATIGGWWFLLSMFDFTPVFINEYTIFNLILGLVTIAALLCSLACAGPFVLWDSIKYYKEEGKK